MATRKVPGVSSMMLGVFVELALNVGLSALLITTCINHSYMFQKWVLEERPKFATVSILCGIYLLFSYVANIFIFYAAVSNSSLKRRKSICCRWLVFRTVSYLIPIAFFIAVRGTTIICIGGGVMLMWFISIGTVGGFMSNLEDAIDEEKNKSRTGNKNMYQSSCSIPSNIAHWNHRPPSQVKPVSHGSKGIPVAGPPPELTEENIRQLEQFQAYIHRTSWCTWSDDGSRSVSAT